jgi:hypothetical protein
MKKFIVLFFITTFFSCNNKKTAFKIDNTYQQTFNKNLTERAKNRINYLQLTGLFKLNALTNSFGKDSINDFVIANEKVPATIGSISVYKDYIIFKASNNIAVTNKQDSIISNIQLNLDKYGSSAKLYYKNLNWQVITRSKQHYLRIWDTTNPAISAFNGFELYELNSEFIFDAQFIYYEKSKTEIVKAEIDGKRSTSFIGKVTFKYQDETYNLEVGESGFTMVSDETTGNETYGGGRYIYLDLPETDGNVILDFNNLYNPPCSFSEFTTCLYPPRQNNLPFKIEAGEKNKQLPAKKTN